MLRTPLTLTAVALMLTLGACSGGGGDRPSNPTAGNGGSASGDNGNNNGNGSNNGSGTDAGTDGDTIDTGSDNSDSTGGDTGGDVVDNGGDTGGDVGGDTGGSPASEPLLAGDSAIETSIKADGIVLKPQGALFTDSSVGIGIAKDGVIRLTVKNDKTTDLDDVNYSFDSAAAVETDRGMMAFVSKEDPNTVLVINDLGGEALGTQLDHTAFGYWGTADADASTDDSTVLKTGGTYYGGLKTANMPTTGTASYAGSAVAIETESASRTVMSELVGTMTATADFANGIVDGSLSLKDAYSNAAWGTVSTGQLNISGTGFSGYKATAKREGSTLNDYTGGAVKGNFFGPDAAEMGGAYDLNNGTTNLRGAFGAKK